MVAISRWLPFAAIVLISADNVKVEYAVKAVENGGTAIGIRCKDGVVLALEKLVTSKLLKSGANKRIATVDRNIGVVSTVMRRHSPSLQVCSNQC